MTPLELRHFMKLNKITSVNVSQKTGYSKASISNYLTGDREMPEAFIDIFKKVYEVKND